MRHKRFYSDASEARGRGRRGQHRGRQNFGRDRAWNDDWEMSPNWRSARRTGQGLWREFDDTFERFGPPPWAPYWRAQAPSELGEESDAIAEPMSRGMGRRMWWNDVSDEERRAWLEARKARLLARQQHLAARLAEIDAELAKLS